MARGLELCGQLWVDRNHHLSFFSHMGVPLLDLFADPLTEGHTDDSRTHVGDPLLGDLGHIFLVRKVFFNTLLLDGEGQDLGDRKVLVLRDVDGLDLFVGKIRLLPTNDIFQK